MWDIELVAIGNEVLSGFVTNTNAAFIGQELLKHGYPLSLQQCLPDDYQSLMHNLQLSLKRCKILISTGGLGPTVDDITRNVAAELFNCGFRYDEEVAHDLEKRYGSRLASLYDQATVPEKARIIPNSLGTAPGLILSNERVTWILLPGIPEEMKHMFIHYVIPYLIHHFPLDHVIYRKAIHLFELSEVAVDPFLREQKALYPDVEFGIYPSSGELAIHLSAAAPNIEEGFSKINPVYENIKNRFFSNFYESESGKIEQAIHSLFIENGWTLSIAESCTGGSASARLTQLPGASQYFLGSVVCYSNELKSTILEVPEEFLRKYGAVSEEVAGLLSEGILKLTGSDFGLAVTGIAGPTGGSQEKPIGTVWGGICRKGKKPYTWKLQARGNRTMIINRSIVSMFSHLLVKARESL